MDWGGGFRLERPRRGMGTDGRLEEDTVECGALSNAVPLPRALQMHAIVPSSRAPNGSARHTFAGGPDVRNSHARNGNAGRGSEPHPNDRHRVAVPSRTSLEIEGHATGMPQPLVPAATGTQPHHITSSPPKRLSENPRKGTVRWAPYARTTQCKSTSGGGICEWSRVGAGLRQSDCRWVRSLPLPEADGCDPSLCPRLTDAVIMGLVGVRWL